MSVFYLCFRITVKYYKNKSLETVVATCVSASMPSFLVCIQSAPRYG